MKRFKSEAGMRQIYDSYDRLLESWDVPVEERDIVTSYGSTHLISAGDPHNPPLLLFHGTADNSAMMWVYNARAFAEHYYVIAIDTIGGSGRSEPNSNYYSHFDQMGWMDEVVDTLGLGKTHMCGVSYGAYLSYAYTLERPERVNKAVCLAGRIPSSTFEVMMKMMAAFLPEALFPTEQSCKRLLSKLTAPGSTVFQENEVLMRHWFYLLKYFNNRSMMQHKIKIHQDHELTALKGKTLFLIGEHDRLTNYKKAIDRLEHNGLNYKVIPCAGHAINHEQAEVINREIREFLSG